MYGWHRNLRSVNGQGINVTGYCLKLKKWIWKVILHFRGLVIVNSWFQYRHDGTAKKTVGFIAV